MEKIIITAGIYNLALTLFHLAFWKIFRWRIQLKKLTVANRGIMQILNVQLTYYFLFTAFLCFFFTNDLLETALGNVFLIGSSAFWAIRSVQQLFFIKVKHPIVGILTVVFIMGAIIFALPFFLR